MWSCPPRFFPNTLKAGFTSALAPEGFSGHRFTFDVQGKGESEDSLASRHWLLKHCKLEDSAWRDVHQVHGIRCLEVGLEGGQAPQEADAIWTRSTGVLLAIRTADCVPLLLTSTEMPLAIAIHAGWRGTHQQIVSKCLGRILSETAVSPLSLRAAIGPAIHSKAFEVDADVALPFRDVYGDEIVVETPGKTARWNVDLIEANRRELLNSGLRDDQIETVDVCTFENHDYWSYRRQRGEAGRQVAWISL